ncbi:hypothetical protein PR048_008313 [Dryococelus australis]|uniref:Uncharacterized protein n=1 Tax=Dryococelus australis TaxID=614101 RepID=A0ABQ9HXL2_9NEOP|nr:hypothetical protein PR048_008313 [Dryococelus australis]
MQEERGKREIPEETRRPAATSRYDSQVRKSWSYPVGNGVLFTQVGGESKTATTKARRASKPGVDECLEFGRLLDLERYTTSEQSNEWRENPRLQAPVQGRV